MKRLFLLIGILTLLASGCGAGNPVDIVKNGRLGLDESITIGKAFDNYKYFKSTKWESFKDSQDRTIVQFTGTLNFDSYEGTKFFSFSYTFSKEDLNA